MTFVSFAYNSVPARMHHSFVVVHTTLCFCLKITSLYITFDWFRCFKMRLKMFLIVRSRFEHFFAKLARPKIPFIGMTIAHMWPKMIIVKDVLKFHIFTYEYDEKDEWDWRQPATGHLYTFIWLLWCNIKYRSLPKDFLHIEHSCVFASDCRLKYLYKYTKIKPNSTRIDTV